MNNTATPPSNDPGRFFREMLDILKAGSSAKPLRLCFDIDGIIATQAHDMDYAKAGPIQPVIDLVNRLHAAGHRIILFTARGTMTGIDWRPVTEDQMKRWGVAYDELKMGKPNADIYIDDRAFGLQELDVLLKAL